MKYHRFFLLTVLFFAINFPSFSQDTSSARYFPLNIGNVWVYYIQSFPPSAFPYVIYKIEGDTIINSIKYFSYNGYKISRISSQWVRYDSAKGNLLVYNSAGGCSAYANDKILDSLASAPGNTIHCQYLAFFTSICLSESNVTLFGNYATQKKDFEHDGLIYGITVYAKNFGIISTCSGDPPPCSAYSTLTGCIINGVVYGDTTLTGINQRSSSAPVEFSLSQNYPNPFNPRTIINYELPASRQGGTITNFVKIKVFDALGKEVATLVNENQNSGSYSVEFSDEGLPSGIYFYKLETGDFTETKRMVLLK